MARSYRDVESTAIATDPQIMAAATAVLSLLGTASDRTIEAGVPAWRLARSGPGGTPFHLSCTGPDLPLRIPNVVISPADIARDRPFEGAWRLVVKAPILVLDLYWQAGKPLRIMTFANGDWQQDLDAMALRSLGDQQP